MPAAGDGLVTLISTGNTVAKGTGRGISDVAIRRASSRARHDVSAAKNLEDQSTEAARANAYFDHAKILRSVEVTYFGESGRASYEFYFVAGSLVLARERQFEYNAPIYFTPAKVQLMLAEEGIKQAAFDPRKTKVVEHLYRFKDEQLAEFTGPKTTMDGSPWSDERESSRIRKTAMELTREFGSP